jgi:hypothetical protein
LPKSFLALPKTFLINLRLVSGALKTRPASVFAKSLRLRYNYAAQVGGQVAGLKQVQSADLPLRQD